ncbi:MAG: hypothetical protein MJ177_05905, partial [Clostridia bacterium]|nr:hypothetical protein [Clostridia bacterium]
MQKITRTGRKALSLLLSLLMIMSVMTVGFAPLASAEIEHTENTAGAVFTLKFNVPESIYLKPGSGDFEYFLTNKLNSAGTTAISDPVKEFDVTVSAPMATAMTLTYQLESNGKKPDRTEVSSDGLSVNIPTSTTGAQSISIPLKGKALSGYTDAIAGNEYFIKWTLNYTAKVDGVETQYTQYAYTSIYAPFLKTAGTSLYFKASPTIGFKPRNSAYSFITGGHTVSGGNYESSFTSVNTAGLEANMAIHKDSLANATYVAPLVMFTGNNDGTDSDDIDHISDYPFNAGATVPAGNGLFRKYTVKSKENGGVYVDNDSDGDGQWFVLDDYTTNAPSVGITVDTSRFPNYKYIPNLSSGWMLYGSYGNSNGTNLRWVAGINTGSVYNGGVARNAMNGDDAKKVTFDAATIKGIDVDTTGLTDEYKSLAKGLFPFDGTVINGHNVIAFAYRTTYAGIGTSTSSNAVVTGVDLNVTATNKAELRAAVCEVNAKGYGLKDDGKTADDEYINAAAAGHKVLADQFATASDIYAAKTALDAKAISAVKEAMDNAFTSKQTDTTANLAFNVPETVYLTPTTSTSSSYQYVLDQTLSVSGGTATITPNEGYKTLASGQYGTIQFWYPDVDTTKAVTLSCTDSGVIFSQFNAPDSNGIYSASVTAGTHSYSSGYITWYVTFTDKTDGYKKTATAMTYVYAPYLRAVAAI